MYSSVSTATEWKQKAIHEQVCSPELEVRILDGNRVTYSLWQFFFKGVGGCGGGSALVRIEINLLRSSGYFTYHQVELSQILHVAHLAFISFIRISGQTATLSLHNINILLLCH